MNKLTCHFLSEHFKVFNLKAVYSYFFIFPFLIHLYLNYDKGRCPPVVLRQCLCLHAVLLITHATAWGESQQPGQTTFEARDCSGKMGTHGWVSKVNALCVSGVQM